MKIIFKGFLIVFFTLALSIHHEIHAQNSFPLKETVLAKLYNFEFSQADSLITSVDSVKNTSDFNFLKTHYYRWSYLPIHEQNGHILKEYNLYLSAIKQQSNKNNDSNETDYNYINSILLKAEFHYNQGSYYKAFQNGSEVYDIIKLKLEKEPKQPEIKFLAALYHYYYQYYRSQKTVYGAMMWLFQEGDKEKGLRWLEEVANEESIVKTEALIYLSHIYLRLENQPYKAYYFAQKLHQKHPQNLKFYELLLESAIASNNLNENMENLANILVGSGNKYFRKYGVTYSTLISIQKEKLTDDERLYKLTKATDFIRKNGGGNHLLSLLYKQLAEIPQTKKSYTSELLSTRVYDYALTTLNK
ncbi:hypothetical protein JKA74_17335 [Marivirga sp. S37H4]|uniref:Uncharacterized protein n=1 Tax=Marivirga aurantiaca TaxID=2802615 RepID=A0A934X1X6_9BACT|nr:hypothetical protein [Marivirga aurantiaca]MBK6266810.1 hypothetical protein [Marivirga aurantiaca]